jgi:hypothetical protein
MNKTLFSLIVILILISCQKSKEPFKIKGSDWLIGKWENKSKEGNLLETWTKVHDSLFVGKSYFIKEKDTLHFEEIELKQKGDNLLYISTIRGENNDKPIVFNQNTEIEKQLVFENSKNDYPRKIAYKPFAKGYLIIEISGVQDNNKSQVMRYSMRKKAKNKSF